MSLNYTIRPLSDRTWFRPASARERSRFTASWTDTLNLLERELDHLRARELILELDVRESDIRNDGQVRANARPASTDAVVVAFKSKHGPLQYRSDIYNAVAWAARGAAPWQHNVRAIALTLESLRAVDRYGASHRGEQYRGYKSIGGGDGVVATGMTTDTAVKILTDESRLPTSEWGDLGKVARLAKASTHPDRNAGNRSRYDAVDQAVQVLERAGRL